MINSPNIILFINFILFFTVNLFCQDKDSNKDDNIKLVFSKNSFHNIKIEDAKATAQILANHIKKVKNLKNDFEVNIVDDENELVEKYSDFDLILLTTEQFIKFKKTLPLEPYCVNYTEGHYGYIYHLIVNQKGNIKDIKDLENESIYIQSHSKDQAASYWLNRLLKDASMQPKEKYFKNIVIDSRASNILLPVFFNKAKACIITDSSLKLLIDLNPGIRNQVKILFSSEPIILGITCLNSKRSNTEKYKILKEILPTLHNTQYGKQFLDLFRASKLVLFKEEYLNGYFNLIK